MANEILYKPVVSDGTPNVMLARRILQLLPDMEANGARTSHIKILRSYIMTTFVERLRGKSPFFDLKELFERATGIPLTLYQALLFGAFARYVNLYEKIANNSLTASDISIDESWFKNSTVTPDKLATFFQIVSAEENQLVTNAVQKNPAASDFTLLRDKPLLKLGGRFYPFDLNFLAEKFESGVFWAVNNSLPHDHRPDFHSFWGGVFEEFMIWFLSESTKDSKNHFYPRPVYEAHQNEEVCDALFICDRSAVLIEFKGSTFTSQAKYGADATTLDAELQLKLVGKDSPKGVRQLAEAANRLCRDKDPMRVKDIDMFGVTTIFPLLITRDDIGSAFYVNEYLNSNFQDLIKDKKKKYRKAVTPLFCMSADDLQSLGTALATVDLARILSGRYRLDKQLKLPFSMVKNGALDGVVSKPSPLITKVGDDLEKMVSSTLNITV